MKAGKIAVIAMSILLTMMVGYALFSESLNINGTASAKGEFDFSVECTPGLTSDVPESFEDISSIAHMSKKEDGYDNDACLVNNKTVDIAVNLKYPTANRMFTIKVTNTGSIPMKIDVDNLSENINRFANESEVDNNDVEIRVPVFYINGVRDDDLALTIEPNQTCVIVCEVFWGTYTDNYNGVSQRVEYSLTLPFIQAE